jgi:signal transduction histidine kinase
LLLFCLVPLVEIGAVWTNQLHHGFWRTITYIPRDPFWDMTLTYGPVYTLVIWYSYAVMATGIAVLVWGALRTFRLYRQQALWMLLGASIPLILNVLEYFKFFDLPGDSTLTGLTLGGIAFARGLFHYRTFEVVPVAREALIENMGDGMLVVDTSQHIVDINPAMEMLLNISATTLVGQTIEVALRPWPALVGHFQGDGPTQSEITLATGDQPHTYDLRLSPLRDRHGRSTGRLMILHDISERKAAEELLLRYTRELEASNAELDAFAHTVAHDLKSPLTIVTGFGMLLEKRYKTLEPDQVEQSLKSIVRTGHKMANIINELLLLSSVRKMDEVSMAELDMAAIIAEARERLVDLIAETQAEIIVPPVWPTVVSYAPWIEEVWVNYLSNALKYGGRPDEDILPFVELGFSIEDALFPADAAAAPKPHSAIRFWVRDNGPGLSPQQRASLFVEFTRLGQVRAGGHGLGLSIVKRIVEKLGGQVGVDSAVGEGATFWFTLPRR